MAELIAFVPALILAIIAIILGILIIAFPKLLRWLIGIYLIIVGIVIILGIVV
ncbi:MAG: DUF3096 domain-containing protein [archaeon]|nr:MAG: DUF3096 domain-containing protein [archaeon]